MVGYSPVVAIAVVAAALIGCTRSKSGGGAVADSGSSATKPASAAPHCKAEGLGAARLVTTWRPPASCHWKGLAAGAATIIHSEADLAAAALDCAQSQARSGIDFTKNDVIVTGRTLSPATVGVDVYDDGKTITFVDRRRSACPNEHPPIPVTMPIALLIPAGGTRSFADASCKQPYECP